MLFIHAGKYTKYMINKDMYTKIERVLSDGFSTRNYGVRSVGSSVSVRIETLDGKFWKNFSVDLNCLGKVCDQLVRSTVGHAYSRKEQLEKSLISKVLSWKEVPKILDFNKRSFETSFQLTIILLSDLSNCPFQLHVGQLLVNNIVL